MPASNNNNKVETDADLLGSTTADSDGTGDAWDQTRSDQSDRSVQDAMPDITRVCFSFQSQRFAFSSGRASEDAERRERSAA